MKTCAASSGRPSGPHQINSDPSGTLLTGLFQRNTGSATRFNLDFFSPFSRISYFAAASFMNCSRAPAASLLSSASGSVAASFGAASAEDKINEKIEIIISSDGCPAHRLGGIFDGAAERTQHSQH